MILTFFLGCDWRTVRLGARCKLECMNVLEAQYQELEKAVRGGERATQSVYAAHANERTFKNLLAIPRRTSTLRKR